MDDTDFNSVPNVALTEDDELEVDITAKWYVNGDAEGDQMPVMILSVIASNGRAGLRLMLTPVVARKLQAMTRLFLEPFEETYDGRDPAAHNAPDPPDERADGESGGANPSDGDAPSGGTKT